MTSHRSLDQVEYIRSPSREYYVTKPQDLWWPFWAWRVIAPEDANETDIFQELLLRLIKAGCHDRSALVKYSCLHNEFVGHLLAILTGKEWLEDWTLTDAGEKAVSEGYDVSGQVRSYYLLQDARTEKLVPRVFPSFDYIDGVQVEENRVSFPHSRQSGKYVRPFMLRTSPIEPSRPSVDEVYKAIRDHRLDRNRLKQAGFESDLLSLYEDQVEFLDDEPFPVYMHLQLFTEPGGDKPWYISDPASMLPSCNEMNKIAGHYLESDKHFASRVESILGIALDEGSTSYDEAKKQLDELARARLIKDFSWVSKFPLIEKYVLPMINDQLELDNEIEEKPWMLERLVSSSQKVCEAVVKQLSPPSEKHDEWKKVVFPGNWKANRPQIKAVYRCCKAVDDDLAWNFSSIREGNLRGAMEKGNQSLRQLLAAMVLRMPDQVMEIERAIPGWLNQAIALAESRNKAEHANEHVTTKIAAYRHLEFVESLLKYIEGNVVNG